MKLQTGKAEKLLRNYCKQRGLKYTPERKRILEAVCALDSHFEADDLYLKLREESGRRISRATVYRTLPLLEESGLIRRVMFVDKHTLYEHVYDHLHHEHLICIKCGKIIEFYKRSLEHSLEDIARVHGFKSVAHKLEITGYCESCSKDTR